MALGSLEAQERMRPQITLQLDLLEVAEEHLWLQMAGTEAMEDFLLLEVVEEALLKQELNLEQGEMEELGLSLLQPISNHAIRYC